MRRFLFVAFTLCLAYVLVLSTGWFPIGPSVGDLLVPGFVGAPATAKPVPHDPVPRHPFMAANGVNSMHNDPYASDAYSGPGPLGRDIQVSSSSYGLKECATLTFNQRGELVALCVSLLGPELKLIDAESLHVIKVRSLPGRDFKWGVNPLADLCGGAYFYLDQLDRAVVATTDRHIAIFDDRFEPVRDYDVSSAVSENDCLIALMPDWSGRIWFESSGGVVGNVDPETGRVQAFETGERIANSFAVDETGGVFVVSDHALYRFAAGEQGEPRVSWREAYERGSAKKPGQLSQGSGTTPTLLGPDLVAITDNAEPRMNVLFYSRSSGRLICGEPVFREGASATENSLIAVGGTGVVVENNYGYESPLTTIFGRRSEPGVSRVDIRDGKCVTVWTSEEVVPSSVSKLSLATGLVYVYGKSDAWYFCAIDVDTGRTVFRALTGAGMQWNNHYAAMALGLDGDAYIATLAGLVRIHDAG